MPPKFARNPERSDLTNSRESERTALLDDPSDEEDFFFKGPNARPSRLLERNDRVSALQGQVDDVVNVMQSNIGKVLDRGDRLEELQDKSEGLSSSAETFRVKSRGLRNQMWWRECRMRILLTIVIVVVLLIILVPIILHFTKK